MLLNAHTLAILAILRPLKLLYCEFVAMAIMRSRKSYTMEACDDDERHLGIMVRNASLGYPASRSHLLNSRYTFHPTISLFGRRHHKYLRPHMRVNSSKDFKRSLTSDVLEVSIKYPLGNTDSKNFSSFVSSIRDLNGRNT